MSRTKVLYTNRTQTIRLSEDVALPDTVTEVDVTVDGSARIITPVGHTWSRWWDRAPSVSDDFLTRHHQPAPQGRQI